jgi:hypothetical protein
VMVRNTRALAGRGIELPPRFAQTVVVEPSPEEAALYEAVLGLVRSAGGEWATRRRAWWRPMPMTLPTVEALIERAQGLTCITLKREPRALPLEGRSLRRVKHGQPVCGPPPAWCAPGLGARPRPGAGGPDVGAGGPPGRRSARGGGCSLTDCVRAPAVEEPREMVLTGPRAAAEQPAHPQGEPARPGLGRDPPKRPTLGWPGVRARSASRARPLPLAAAQQPPIAGPPEDSPVYYGNRRRPRGASGPS